ncbi:MAG: hypothetical protein K2X81_14935, partial [Candidatus Obscuribacterales bacterium]|nr:hypothetical protein [Candidatus Obscuribacterales bacterium]
GRPPEKVDGCKCRNQIQFRYFVCHRCSPALLVFKLGTEIRLMALNEPVQNFGSSMKAAPLLLQGLAFSVVLIPY